MSEEKFIKFLLKVDRNEITGNLWNRLLCRQKEKFNKENRYTKKKLGKQFLFDGQEEHNISGIIRYFKFSEIHC